MPLLSAAADQPRPRRPTQPAPKPPQLPEIGPRMSGIRSDAELAAFLAQNRAKGGAGAAVVEFGTAWCTKCHEMFPAFYALSKMVTIVRVSLAWTGAELY
jgi:hypothetical protein